MFPTTNQIYQRNSVETTVSHGIHPKKTVPSSTVRTNLQQRSQQCQPVFFGGNVTNQHVGKMLRKSVKLRKYGQLWTTDGKLWKIHMQHVTRFRLLHFWTNYRLHWWGGSLLDFGQLQMIRTWKDHYSVNSHSTNYIKFPSGKRPQL